MSKGNNIPVLQHHMASGICARALRAACWPRCCCWSRLAVGGMRLPDKQYAVVHTYPHDRGAFTQGLSLSGRRALREHGPERTVIAAQGRAGDGQGPAKGGCAGWPYFAEGLAELNGKLYQLTWTNHVAFVYDLERR